MIMGSRFGLETGLVTLDADDIKHLAEGFPLLDIWVMESANVLEELEKALNESCRGNERVGVLVQITGNENLQTDDVNRIGGKIEAHAGKESQIIWGCDIEPGRKETKVAMLVFRKQTIPEKGAGK